MQVNDRERQRFGWEVRRAHPWAWVVSTALLWLAIGCGDDPEPAENGTGGAGPGGSVTGGSAGGDTTGGVATGGLGSGGIPTGGTATGGVTTGGIPTGGAGGEGGATGGTDPAGGAGTGGVRSEPWRIEPLGDSITDTTCYPKLLSQLLIDSGRTNFTFVGSRLNNQGCGDGVPNVYTEGHGGYLVTQLLPGGSHESELPTWCTTNQAEIVLMHFGTNDTWNSITTERILEAFSLVLDAHRAANPTVIFFVAQIIPNAGCSTCDASIPELNTAIVTWASEESTESSPVYVVDQFTGFDPETDTGDGTHPNVAGSNKMAQRWADALAAEGLL